MPTYEYECRSCGAGFDVFQSMSDAPLEVCPTCGSSVRRKINGGTGIIFKGSGFYKNDNRKAESSGGESGRSSRSGASSEGSKSEGGKQEGGNHEGKSSSESAPASTSAPAPAPSSSESSKKEAH